MENIKTGRLILRPYTLADAPFLLELLNSPPWLKFIGDRGVRTNKDATDYLRDRIINSYEERHLGMYAVVEKTSQKTIGSCGLVDRDSIPDIDLGFAFLPGYEGKGYGYEASLAVLGFAKNKLSLNRLAAITLPTNLASIGLLKKLGFTFERMIKFEDDGEELEYYGMEFLNNK